VTYTEPLLSCGDEQGRAAPRLLRDEEVHAAQAARKSNMWAGSNRHISTAAGVPGRLGHHGASDEPGEIN